MLCYSHANGLSSRGIEASVVTCSVRGHAGDVAAGTAFSSRDTVAERGHVLRA